MTIMQEQIFDQYKANFELCIIYKLFGYYLKNAKNANEIIDKLAEAAIQVTEKDFSIDEDDNDPLSVLGKTIYSSLYDKKNIKKARGLFNKWIKIVKKEVKNG